MKIPSYRIGRPFGANLTPMIDVVFLLIIFFLVSSHLAQRENQVDLDLPAATSGVDQREPGRSKVTLNVLPNGSMEMAGSPVAARDLAARLAAAKTRRGDDLELRIRSDRSVHYGDVSPIMAAAAANGIGNVTFAVVQSAESQ